MKEREFQYYLVKHYKITEFEFVGIFTYRFAINNLYMCVSFNECNGKLLPWITIANYKNGDYKYYQSFRKALNYIEKEVTNEN